ncbi:1,4-beta-xylanase, partial [Mycolicibacterium porcinum]
STTYNSLFAGRGRCVDETGTSGVWQGSWDRGSRSEMDSFQLDNSDIISFHSYAGPAEFEARIAELAPLGRPILCTEYLARDQGSTVEGVLPVAKRHNVGAYSWGLVAGKTQTYFPWDSWDKPYTKVPNVWFSDLLQPDGRPYKDSEYQTLRKLTTRV